MRHKCGTNVRRKLLFCIRGVLEKLYLGDTEVSDNLYINDPYVSDTVCISGAVILIIDGKE